LADFLIRGVLPHQAPSPPSFPCSSGRFTPLSNCLFQVWPSQFGSKPQSSTDFSPLLPPNLTPYTPVVGNPLVGQVFHVPNEPFPLIWLDSLFPSPFNIHPPPPSSRMTHLYYLEVLFFTLVKVFLSPPPLSFPIAS